MKTTYYLFAAACIAFASCANDDSVSNGGTDVPQGASDQVVTLNVTSPSASVSTRGTGTVGGMTKESNKWHGQKINVFMFEKDSLKLASLNDDQDYLYNNTEMYTPGHGKDATPDSTGLASCVNGDIKYYPLLGQFDFWGYHLDDAVNGDVIYNDTTVEIPFKMNGSQDILTAETKEITDADIASHQYSGMTALVMNDIYSAKASRHGIQPNLLFKHQLTRITFSAKAGVGSASDAARTVKIDSVDHNFIAPQDANKSEVSLGVYIDTIKLYSATTGRLVAAYCKKGNKNIKAQRIIWQETKGNAEADSTFFYLMQRKSQYGVEEPADSNLVTLESFLPSSSDSYFQVGEALFVSPNKNMKYKIQIIMHQYKKLTDDWFVKLHPEKKEIYKSIDLYYPADYQAEKYIDLNTSNVTGITDPKGYSFNVNMTIYGLDRIDISSTLEKWKDGGNIQEAFE